MQTLAWQVSLEPSTSVVLRPGHVDRLLESQVIKGVWSLSGDSGASLQGYRGFT